MLRFNTTRPLFSIGRRFYAAKGDSIPSTTLYDGSPGNDINLAEETAHGKSILIGIPGAFSPACSASHVPGYLKNLRAFNDKGFSKFFIISVNDPFVMKSFGNYLTQELFTNQVKFLADSRGEFSKELGVVFDATKVFGNERSKRYALVVEDGKIVDSFIEPDNTSVDVSDATKVLKSL
ncbi:unnamed protein product [Candida verbasci]|uniref:Thioredoxin domain-containing protein n=1 Tax=Candida verbasci TaxID=1227364 RepID=A0A9W4TVY6_9ASCO|nr:unnamed protein product [Candida verbasci]